MLGSLLLWSTLVAMATAQTNITNDVTTNLTTDVTGILNTSSDITIPNTVPTDSSPKTSDVTTKPTSSDVITNMASDVTLVPNTTNDVTPSIFAASTPKNQTVDVTTAMMSSGDVNATSDVMNASCIYVPGLYLGSRKRELECCAKVVEDMRFEWALGTKYLTRFLDMLTVWGCPQLASECQLRYYALNEFTTLVYDRFCNHSILVGKCLQKINNILVENNRSTSPHLVATTSKNSSNVISMTNNSNNNVSIEWSSAVARLASVTLGPRDLVAPCVQIALYEAEPMKHDDYHEIVHSDVPGCALVWCGFDGGALRGGGVSAWTCMDQSCRSGLIAIMVFCGFAGLVITITNLTVVAVIVSNPALRHSQSIYKLSIAVGDILVGLIVFPTFASTLTKLTLTPHFLGSYDEVKGYQKVNGSLREDLSALSIRQTSGLFKDILGVPYSNFVGFVTILSLIVSVYSLTIAGFDRLTAVYRPLRYRKDNAKRLAVRLCVGIWLVGVLVATLPFYVPSLEYSLIVSFLIASGGTGALILYAVGFVIPLLIMWVVTILTYVSTRKHAKVRSHLTKDSKSKTRSVENRLARTLSLMVGCFTASFLPAAVVIIAGLSGAPGIYPFLPEDFRLSAFSAFKDAEFATVVILTSNSLWNFFIYNARNREFKRAVGVLYKELARRTRLALCWNSTYDLARRLAHDGRRRLSSIPTITTTYGGRKKSLSSEVTSTTKLRRESGATTGTRFTEQSSNAQTTSVFGKSSEASSSSAPEVSTRSVADSTMLESESGSGYKPKYAKNPKKKKKTEEDVGEDSIFQSFAIDANADRLFVSVMENIDEEIEVVVEDKKQETKV